jgi:hypothetical protein
MFLRTRGRASGCLTLTLLAIAGPALAQSPNVVISQVYGGGGNSNAPYRNDFVELFNRGDTAFTMTNWSIQYASATGTSWGSNKVTISATLEPGQYFLIQLASGGAIGVALPTPDAQNNTINISATAGKVALVNSSTSLPANPCPGAGNGVVDFIGYGASANCSEGSPAPAPSNTTAALRADGGCTDTDDNFADFSALAPDPRNSASAFHVCSGQATGACCVGTTCHNGQTQAECAGLGGVWHNGIGCDTNPCNATTGACCSGDSCTVDTQANCLASGHTYMGNGISCTPNPCVTCISIATAKANGAGFNVKLCDIVISNKTDLISDLNTKSFQAQQTIAGVTRGITVFGSNAEIDAVLAGKTEGSKINIYGMTDQYNGLFQLVAPNSATKTSQPGIPTPLSVTPADFATGSSTAEGLESCLVKANCVMFTPPPAPGATFAADTDYYVMDNVGTTMAVRCTGGTLLVGTAIPTGWVNVQGVFYQFDSSSPYDGGYQLLPRLASDFTAGSGCGAVTGSCCISGTCQGGHTQTTCATAGGTYNGDGSSCVPNPCTCEGIALAKGAGPGQLVRICEATFSNDIDLIGSSSYATIQLQDATGAITVFGTTAEIATITGHAFLYDTITVRGTTSEYNGLFELDTPTFEANYGAGVAPTPIAVTATDFQTGSPAADALESAWVALDCVTFEEGGGTFAASANYIATGASGEEVTVRVSTSTQDMIGQPIPTGSVNITGIFSQYDTTNPYNGDYELLLTTITDPTRLGKIEANPGCVPPVGACCLAGTCTPGLDLAGCTTLGGDYLGDGTGCSVNMCPEPVVAGDVAFGLSLGSRIKGTEHIRNGILVGGWPGLRFLQSMEFDNSAAAHSACGNLLAVDYGSGGGTPGSSPTCTDPNRLGEAAKIYNLATDGTSAHQQIYDFNLLAGGVECTRASGLSVSPNNNYLALWGVDTGHLCVLAYNPGTQPGSGTGVPFITAEWVYNGLAVPTGSQGTAWYDPNTILTYNTDWIPGWTTLNRIRFNGTTFTLLGSVTIPVANSGGSMFTDVEFNPAVSPYVFCLLSNFTSPTSSTYLTAVNPAAWSIVKTLDISTVVQTGREIALGPDGYLYIAQYTGAIDRINVANPAGWVATDVLDYYLSAQFTAYCGLDVAFDCPSPSGACCHLSSCLVCTELQCAGLGGHFQGAGTSCTTETCACRGDCDCNGIVDFDDINPFVAAISGATPCSFENCDLNNDGVINFDDINPFVAALSTGTTCP